MLGPGSTAPEKGAVVRGAAWPSFSDMENAPRVVRSRAGRSGSASGAGQRASSEGFRTISPGAILLMPSLSRRSVPYRKANRSYGDLSSLDGRE